MATESYYQKLVNDVLEATEQIANRMEDGLSALLTGELPKLRESGAGAGTGAFSDQEFEGLDDDEMLHMSEEELMRQSPLSGIADSVIGNIMQSQVGPQTTMDHFQAFKSAITWSEPLIYSLLIFQITMFLLCIWVSRPNRGSAPRIVLLVLIFVVVRSAEYLNGWGARNWESFCTQNYFDRKGIFVGIMLCGPLLMDCFLLLLMFLREASQLLIKVKRRELRKGKEPEKKKKEGSVGNPKKKNKATKKED
jgi:hypothetical protein